MSEPLKAELRRLILSSNTVEASQPSDYPFVADIVGNTICADLLDYLKRDHKFSGLPSKLGHRFIDGFYVTPSTQPYFPRHMALAIRKGDHIRADMVSELLKYLRYRYELSERVLVHHTKLAADAMVGKALEMWYDVLRADVIAGAKNRKAAARPKHIDDVLDDKNRSAADEAAREQVEAALLRMGDDGLLEHLADLSLGDDSDPRSPAIRSLATALLERRLYKRIAVSDAATRAIADQIYQKHGSFETRRRLERECAQFAGLDHSWHVLLWIPAPRMRMKAVQVLVDDGDRVLPFDAYDKQGSKRASEIYLSHEDLWSVGVYTHASVTDEACAVMLAFLRERIGAHWDGVTPTSIIQLAARRVAREQNLTRHQEEDLATPVAAFEGGTTFADIVNQLRDAAAAPPPAPAPTASE